MEEEPVKYFSLPRPKYSRNPEKIVPQVIDLPKVKYRTNAEQFRQKRVGGRRFTVDVTSNEVETALVDVVHQKKVSRSISTLNKPIFGGEINLRQVPKPMKSRTIMEEDERPKGPEFIVNSTAETMNIDISDNKVQTFNIYEIQIITNSVSFRARVKVSLTFYCLTDEPTI